MIRHVLRRLLMAVPTDPALVRAGPAATAEAAAIRTDPGLVRPIALANAERTVTENSIWIALVREQLWMASARRVQGVRAHGIDGLGVGKGLDITVGK